MKHYYRIGFAMLWILMSPLSHTHKPGDRYVNIDRSGQALNIQWAIALRGLDSNADEQITWGELQAAESRVNNYALAHLNLYYDGKIQAVETTGLFVDNKSDGTYAVLSLRAPGPTTNTTVEPDYHLLFDIDPTHRGLIAYHDGQQHVARHHPVSAFPIREQHHSPSSRTISLKVSGTSWQDSIIFYSC